MKSVVTPRDAQGMVDHNAGWPLWSDFVRYYPSGVHRRRLIAEWVRPLAARSVLDVGCGPGHLIESLRRVLPAASFTGVDSADQTMISNAARLPGCRFLPLDIAERPLDERFDLVVCTEVLEHVADDQRALVNLVAMTGRHLMITVPTGPILPLEAGFGHFRHYRLDALRAAVEANGLHVVRAEAWGFPWMTLFKRASNLRPQAILDAFGAGAWSWPKRAVGRALTALFYLNLKGYGPQLLLLAERR